MCALLKQAAKRFFILLAFILVMSSTPVVSEASWDNQMKGFAFLPQHQHSYCTSEFFQTIDNLKTVGVNTVSFIVPYYQTNMNSNDLHRGHNTPTDEALKCGIEYVQSKGLGIAILVHADSESLQWRAKLDPNNRDVWFRSMGAVITKYARDFAQPYNAKFLSIGTEMHHMVSNEYNAYNADAEGRYRWPDIIADARQHYTGKIAYGAQHSGGMSAVFEDNDLMPNIDLLGFSAYWRLETESATPEQLHNAWQGIESRYIIPAHQKYNNVKIIFTEGGYRSCPTALTEPWNNWDWCQYDGDTQAKGYDAMLSYFANKSYMAGMPSLWAWEVVPSIGGVGNIQYTPWGKPAEQIIRNHWGNGSNTSDASIQFSNICLKNVNSETNGHYGWNPLTREGCHIADDSTEWTDTAAYNSSNDDTTSDDGDDTATSTDDTATSTDDDTSTTTDDTATSTDDTATSTDDDTATTTDDDETTQGNDGTTSTCVATLHSDTNGGWGWDLATEMGCMLSELIGGNDDDDDDTATTTDDTATSTDDGSDVIGSGYVDDTATSTDDTATSTDDDTNNNDDTDTQSTCVSTIHSDTNGGWGWDLATEMGCMLSELVGGNDDTDTDTDTDNNNDDTDNSDDTDTDTQSTCVATVHSGTNGGWGWDLISQIGCLLN